jgi:hypothetical protein
MFITKADLLRQLGEAWERGHSAGYDHGDALATWTMDGSIGCQRGPEPVQTPNPYA